MRARLLVLLLTLLVGSAGAAPVSSPENVRAARATPVGRTVLPNGLTLLVTESPAEDMVAVELLVKVGLVEEKTNMAGVTRLVQEILKERISDDETLELSGSLLKVETEPDYARISLLTTTEHFPNLLATLGQALANRTFTQAELDEARRTVIDDLDNQQGAFPQLYEIFRQTFYRYHPYRKSDRGSKLALERLDPTVLSQYFDTYYVPNKMVLSVAGRVDRLKLVERVRQEFGTLANRDQRLLEIPWEPKASEKEIQLSASSSIGWLFIGFPAPSVASQDYAAMRLIHAILGDGLSSRLFTEIREKKGLAYELGSVYPNLRGPSHLLTYIITKPSDAGRARDLLVKEVERLKKERVSADELVDARRKVVGKYLLERETNQGKALNVAIAEIIGLGYEYDVSFLKELEKVTPMRLQEVATRYLDNATLVVARPPGIYFDL